ncbi:MAG: NUDIX domain-containing protein [Bacteriovorax sp.]
MKSKTKVLAYILRTNNDLSEVLVFDHRDNPSAGTQIIGGTVDPGEELIGALLREIREESGLVLGPSDIAKKLGETHYQRRDIPEINHRHYYLIYSKNLPDTWAHTVHSEGLDNGMVFDFFWLSIDQARKDLTGNFGELLP